MAKIVKTKWNNINGGTDRTDIYPITSDRAVYNADNKTMREIIRVRGVVNISTYFTYDGTPEKLTLETALKKITEENRCPGFLATILTTEDEWWTFRYNAYTVDDDSWNNTNNWSPFHAGWLKTDTTSEDPETPLHLEWVVKNYIYTLKGWIDAVSTERNGYFTAEDYKKFLQALEDIKNLQERMTAAEATIKDHESRLSTAESAISGIQSDISNIKGDITSIQGDITNINGEIDELNKAISNLDVGVTTVRATSSSTILTASPSNATSGDVTVGIGLNESELEAWLKEHDFDPGSVDTGVTSVIASKIGDSDTQSILNISPTSRSDSAAKGDATIGIGINSDALNSWLQNNGYGGGNTPVVSSGASVWIGEGNLNISPYGNIDRSALYPSSDYGTPQVGDTVLWFYINTSGVQTVVIAEVTGVSGSTVSTSTKVSWAIGSGEGGAVDTVQIKHIDDDATNILTINPTEAQSGTVVVNMGIAEDNLKSWLNNNGYGSSSSLKYYHEERNEDEDFVFAHITVNKDDTGTANGTTVISPNLAQYRLHYMKSGYALNSEDVWWTTDYKGEEVSILQQVVKATGKTKQPRTVFKAFPDFFEWYVDQEYGSDYAQKLVLDRNGLKLNGVSIGGSDVSPYPDVSTDQSNPTDIYFTSNQLITGSANGSFTMTFRSTNGIAGAEVQIILKAGSSGATITIAGDSAVVTDDYNIVTVEANKYVELNAIYDGSRIYVRSSSKES